MIVLLSSAQNHDVLMAARIDPDFGDFGETLGKSWPWNLHFISKRSRHAWQGKVILQRGCICSRDANLTDSSQTKCHLGTCLATGSVETTKWSLQTRVAAGSSMIPLLQQVGSEELHLSSLTLTESLMMSLLSNCAILNRCLHSSTIISVYLMQF